mgnify:FL=1
MLKTSKKQYAGEQILESVKLLFQVFTNKLLFVEWLLAVNLVIGKKLTMAQARIEADEYVATHDDIDMRTAPPAVRNNRLYDESVLKMRWDLCSSCEFLTDSLTCSKCKCPMLGKYKLAHSKCPIGKWGKYKAGVLSGSTVTS